jgi:hypothetical protein
MKRFVLTFVYMDGNYVLCTSVQWVDFEKLKDARLYGNNLAKLNGWTLFNIYNQSEVDIVKQQAAELRQLESRMQSIKERQAKQKTIVR